MKLYVIWLLWLIVRVMVRLTLQHVVASVTTVLLVIIAKMKVSTVYLRHEFQNLLLKPFFYYLLQKFSNFFHILLRDTSDPVTTRTIIKF